MSQIKSPTLDKWWEDPEFISKGAVHLIRLVFWGEGNGPVTQGRGLFLVFSKEGGREHREIENPNEIIGLLFKGLSLFYFFICLGFVFC